MFHPIIEKQITRINDLMQIRKDELQLAKDLEDEWQDESDIESKHEQEDRLLEDEIYEMKKMDMQDVGLI